MVNVTVLGAGSWGTALAEIQAQRGHRVCLWDRNPSRIDEIQKTHQNSAYHPGITLSPQLQAVSKLEEACSSADVILLAVPSIAIREVVERLSDFSNAILVSATKGLEVDSLFTISQVLADVLGEKILQRYAVLSGPSFAADVIEKTPTAVTVASTDLKVAQKVQQFLHTETFHIYASDDVVGVELAGALKNVIAITAGASDGFNFGQSARAALITRGLAEISRIGRKKGAHPLTFAGLSGLGDLVLTCTGDLSRNRRVGLKLAQGKSLKVVLQEVKQTAEGIRTAKAAWKLAQSLGVETPIIEGTYQALFEAKSPKEIVARLLSQPPMPERD